MQPIFLIVGGPGVGKSTTCRALAATFDRAIHIDVDRLREMVVSGLALPDAEWGDEVVLQVRLAREAAIRMADAYADAGFAVVLDDFHDPNRLAEYDELLRRPGASAVLLYPTMDEARRRNAVRSPGAAGAFIDAAIPGVYAELTPLVDGIRAKGWLVLDTTDMDVDAAVAAIRDRAALEAG
jgi:predicted kinase